MSFIDSDCSKVLIAIVFFIFINCTYSFCQVAEASQVQTSQGTPSIAPSIPQASPSRESEPATTSAPQTVPGTQAQSGDFCANNPCDAIVLSSDQRFVNVGILVITNEIVTIKASYMKDEGLQLDRKKVSKIIFKGGSEDAKGILLKNGMNFSGEIKDFRDGTALIQVGGLDDSDLRLNASDILSINFADPNPTPLSRREGGSNPSHWKYHTTKNILEWIYQDSDKNALKGAKFNLNIEKISLASNQIVLSAKAWEKEFDHKNCAVVCTLEDDLKTNYPEITTRVHKLAASRDRAQELRIQGPSPDKDAKEVIIKLKPMCVRCSRASDCGNTKKWSVLPAFSLELLK